jgi:hypothetical protein
MIKMVEYQKDDESKFIVPIKDTNGKVDAS